MPDWHTDWAAWKHFVAVLQDKSPCDGHCTLSLPFPTYHSQSRFLSIPWHRPYQHSDKSILGATFLPQVWLHHHLGAFNTPALKQQECYRIEKRPTQLASLATSKRNSFHKCGFRLDQCLYHTLTHPHKKRNLPSVLLYTSEEHYHWKTWRVTLHNVIFYTTPDKLLFQLQITSGLNNSESMPMKTPGLGDLRFQDMFRWELFVSKGRVSHRFGELHRYITPDDFQ